MSLRQNVFKYLDNLFESTGSLEIDNAVMYKVFPKHSENSVRTYVNQWKKTMYHAISHKQQIKKKVDISEKEIEEEIKQKKITRITKDLVEKWIIRGDDRAKYGMQFLQQEDKYKEKAEDLEKEKIFIEELDSYIKSEAWGDINWQ